jgi:hypothetical protein
LSSAAPKELAPNLFAIAKFKRRLVGRESHNNSWIRNLAHISTPVQLDEFSILFMPISDITLQNSNDMIFWKWTADRKFSVATAYECQFVGAMVSFPAPDIWQAFSDHKSNFFAWLVLHNRVLTADNMMKKNWPSDPLSSFCLCCQETTQHILAECNYTEVVWNLVANLFNLPDFAILQSQGNPSNWLQALLEKSASREKRKCSGILFMVWLLLWKERNNKIFERKERSPIQLAMAIKEAFSLVQAAGTSAF